MSHDSFGSGSFLALVSSLRDSGENDAVVGLLDRVLSASGGDPRSPTAVSQLVAQAGRVPDHVWCDAASLLCRNVVGVLSNLAREFESRVTLSTVLRVWYGNVNASHATQWRDASAAASVLFGGSRWPESLVSAARESCGKAESVSEACAVVSQLDFSRLIREWPWRAVPAVRSLLCLWVNVERDRDRQSPQSVDAAVGALVECARACEVAEEAVVSHLLDCALSVEADGWLRPHGVSMPEDEFSISSLIPPAGAIVAQQSALPLGRCRWERWAEQSEQRQRASSKDFSLLRHLVGDHQQPRDAPLATQRESVAGYEDADPRVSENRERFARMLLSVVAGPERHGVLIRQLSMRIASCPDSTLVAQQFGQNQVLYHLLSGLRRPPDGGVGDADSRSRLLASLLALLDCLAKQLAHTRDAPGAFDTGKVKAVLNGVLACTDLSEPVVVAISRAASILRPSTASSLLCALVLLLSGKSQATPGEQRSSPSSRLLVDLRKALLRELCRPGVVDLLSTTLSSSPVE